MIAPFEKFLLEFNSMAKKTLFPKEIQDSFFIGEEQSLLCFPFFFSG